MLRENAWATELCRRALTDLAASVTDSGVVLRELLAALCEMLPNSRARASLKTEKANAPAFAAEWIATNGLGNWLQYLVAGPRYPANWWGVPGFERAVDLLCDFVPGPPDPDSFRKRLLHAPWKLTDDQAEYVCEHRYDMAPHGE